MELTGKWKIKEKYKDDGIDREKERLKDSFYDEWRTDIEYNRGSGPAKNKWKGKGEEEGRRLIIILDMRNGRRMWNRTETLVWPKLIEKGKKVKGEDTLLI
jgi:hypothetical protein